ncbi:MAG: hypothetical protein ACQESQ_07925 [Bacteroidota bacterium]
MSFKTSLFKILFNYGNHNLYIVFCAAENKPGYPTVLKKYNGNGITASSAHKFYHVGVVEYVESN